jgi:hypothetical protein
MPLDSTYGVRVEMACETEHEYVLNRFPGNDPGGISAFLETAPEDLIEVRIY